MKLDGSRGVVVCGATGGLGPAVVDAFATRGDTVVAVSHSKADLAALSGIQSVIGEVADLTEPQEVEGLWKRIDDRGIDVRSLVNLTGGWRGGDLISTSPDDYRFIIDLNLTTVWLSCRSGAPRLIAAGGGAIVNVGSKSALKGGAGEAAYAVAKAGVVRMTQVLAAELKDEGVRVNAVIPAVIDTPANRETLPRSLVNKAAAPEGIAKVIWYLCSEDSALVNGAAIPVFGQLLE